MSVYLAVLGISRGLLVREAQHVLHARAWRRPQQHQAVGELAGEVLGGVHGEVDLLREQRVLDRVHPARLVAGMRVTVTAGGQGHDVRVTELLGDEACLRERERAGAGTDAQTAHRRGSGRARAAGADGARELAHVVRRLAHFRCC